ncbi:SPX-domain-containing protein [Russula ochroleuca]|uniref:SPX-domain-containing protein n=1 Tax=Russula ochroleuca TaxID=152965 RepID=A0A9P5MQD9_9AGAM|nr:SPX-domain-containing protein [Russula ochroleuca]
MKFSSSLKFNAQVEWWDEYIAYDALKRYIYHLEKQKHEALLQSHDVESATEQTFLVDRVAVWQDTDALFKPLLDAELKKISSFYALQETQLLQELAELEELVKEQDEIGMLAGRFYSDSQWDEDDDEDEDEDHWGSTERSHEPSTSKRRRRVSTSAGRAMSQGAHHSREVPTRPRRVSVSSTEENLDLEASLASIGRSFPAPVPEGEEPRPRQNVSRSGTRDGESLGRSRSQTVGVRIANRLRSSIASLGSPHGPAPGNGETIWTSKKNFATDTQLLFKRRITNLYVQVSALRSYVELNYSGFRKVLKKYDKVTESSLQAHYLHDILEPTPAFDQASRARIADAQSALVHLYAKCVMDGDTAAAQRYLKLNLREHIAWERDTVWRQMIGRERRGEGGTPLGAPVDTTEEKAFEVHTRVGRVRLSRRKTWIIISALIFAILLNVSIVEGDEANRCFAVLVFATLLWATEAIPLFVTSTMVPALLVWLRVIRDADTELNTYESRSWIFSVMFSPTIMLLIGGFTIAAALSKTNIDRVLITRVLSLAGTRPSVVLLAVMGVACFASMWIRCGDSQAPTVSVPRVVTLFFPFSNVAAPTLCFTLVRLAIALAANIGGQSSPISSPQNLIALQAMEPQLDWGRWFLVALPVSGVSIVLIWLLLLVSYRPSRLPMGGSGNLEIKTIRPTRERFTVKQWWVTFVCVATITLWVVEHGIEKWIGDMGVIAIIPIVAFFGSGVLKKDDFEQFLWSVVFLAMGGIALGKGVTSSGLLDKMDILIRRLVEGRSEFGVIVVLTTVVLIVSTFISHTIASVLLVPIAKTVGENLPGNQANLLVFITGLVCSTGMGMPVSGFPNQTAATQEDEMGQLYLTNVDFLKNGVPASVIAALVVASLGYALMKLIGCIVFSLPFTV